MEKRKIKVTKKTQTIYETPWPTKDPELVEEVIKVLIGHVEIKMNTKVDGLHTLKNQPKIVESYEELDKKTATMVSWKNHKKDVIRRIIRRFNKKTKGEYDQVNQEQRKR